VGAGSKKASSGAADHAAAASTAAAALAAHAPGRHPSGRSHKAHHASPAAAALMDDTPHSPVKVGW
jgi:hypothetical protein